MKAFLLIVLITSANVHWSEYFHIDTPEELHVGWLSVSRFTINIKNLWTESENGIRRTMT